jgi:hypothetical protein
MSSELKRYYTDSECSTLLHGIPKDWTLGDYINTQILMMASVLTSVFPLPEFSATDWLNKNTPFTIPVICNIICEYANVKEIEIRANDQRSYPAVYIRCIPNNRDVYEKYDEEFAPCGCGLADGLRYLRDRGDENCISVSSLIDSGYSSFVMCQHGWSVFSRECNPEDDDEYRWGPEILASGPIDKILADNPEILDAMIPHTFTIIKRMSPQSLLTRRMLLMASERFHARKTMCVEVTIEVQVPTTAGYLNVDAIAKSIDDKKFVIPK